MEITDYTEQFNISSCRSYSILFPEHILCVIAGSTGSGKTNLMLNLLKKEKLLNYNHVYVYSSTLYQPAYEHLKSYYGTLEQLILDETNKEVKIEHFFDADDEILNPTCLDKSIT